MKKIVTLILSVLVLSIPRAQDTFSVVAVDSATGEVGSAGASCLDNKQFPGSGGAILISDVLPGVGVVHTQSYWNASNQYNANARMKEGLGAEEIIDWLENNDVQGNPRIRQYGAATLDLDGRPEAAAFTGVNCLDYKNHNVGLYYAIQGNILLGQAILDSMESRFLNTPGDLATKLMASLQGANVPGADVRCLNEGVSSLSAFVRVARPDDEPGNLYLDLNVPSTPFGVEPIDSLQSLFDDWRNTLGNGNLITREDMLYPNPTNGLIKLRLPDNQDGHLRIFALSGECLIKVHVDYRSEISLDDLSNGIYLAMLTHQDGLVSYEKLILTK